METGEKLMNFSLLSVDGKKYTKYDFADKFALVVIISCNHCPYAMAYWKRLKKLFNRYEDDSLAIVAINPNDETSYPQDSYENMVTLSKKLSLPFPYLRDKTQTFTHKLGVERTPEALVFNSKRELVYQGAIDDNWEHPEMVTHVYLEDAIEDALDGVDVDFPYIKPVGCSIKWNKKFA